MRGLLIAMLVAVVSASASAQVRRQSETPSVRAEQSGFASRSAADRAATATRLLGARVAPQNLSTPFVVTPRAPVAPGRGYLSGRAMSFFPMSGTSGWIIGAGNRHTEIIVTVTNAQGRRLLVDFAIPTNVTSSGYLVQVTRQSNGEIIMTQTVQAHDGLVSIVTPVLPGDVEISVRLSVPLSVDWHFYGCEVTPLST